MWNKFYDAVKLANVGSWKTVLPRKRENLRCLKFGAKPSVSQNTLQVQRHTHRSIADWLCPELQAQGLNFQQCWGYLVMLLHHQKRQRRHHDFCVCSCLNHFNAEDKNSIETCKWTRVLSTVLSTVSEWLVLPSLKRPMAIVSFSFLYSTDLCLLTTPCCSFSSLLLWSSPADISSSIFLSCIVSSSAPLPYSS